MDNKINFQFIAKNLFSLGFVFPQSRFKLHETIKIVSVSHMPGWNSLESVTSIQNVLTILSYFSLGLLLFFEVAAHVYEGRKEHLTNQISAQKDEELASLKNRVSLQSKELFEIKLKNLDRVFEENDYKDIVRTLSTFKGHKLKIVCTMNDSKNILFANKIQNALKSAGWNTSGNYSGLSDGSKAGLQVYTKKKATPALIGLINFFREKGENVYLFEDVSDLNEDLIELLPPNWKPNPQDFE